MRTSAASLALLLLSPVVVAQESPPGKVIVDFAASDPADAWIASALEHQLAAELSRFRRIDLEEKADTRACQGREPRCLIAAHAALAEVIAIGNLAGGQLTFEVHETWTRSMATRGTIEITGGLSPGGLRHRLGEIVRPIVQSGGLLDQRPAAVLDDLPDAGVVPAADGGVGTADAPAASTRASPLAFGVLLLGLLAIPLLFGLLLAGRRLLATRSARRAIWLLLLGGAAIAAAAFLPAAAEVIGSARAYLGHPVSGLALNLVGGMLWAAFALLNLSFAFPLLPGIGRIRPDALWRVLRAWAATALMRVALLAVYVPLLFGVLLAGRWLAIGGRLLWSVVIPAAGLLAVLWFLLLVDVLAAYLDRKLVVGPPTRDNPWHATARRYLRGYVRRTGPDVSSQLLSRTLFLPGRGTQITSYGGGFGAPRVLIGQRLLELALGQPEEPEKEQRQVNTEELDAGIVVPQTGARTSRSRKGGRRQGRDRRRQGPWPVRPRGFAPRMIGEAATLLGWVLPAQRVSTVPLVSDSREDYEVVQSLLTEHYAAFEKDAWDDDDDSDPRHKDLLHGALLRELGAAQRQETLLSTLRLAWVELFAGFAPLRLLGNLAGRIYLRLLSRAPAVVADAYVALNSGLHHLVQLYDWLRTQDETPLTARGDGPKLYGASRDALDRVVKSPPDALDKQNFRATLRSRLVELSAFFHVPIEEAHVRSFRFAALAVAAALAVGLLGLSVNNSLDYHPVYVERMRALSEAADAGPDSGGTDGGTQ